MPVENNIGSKITEQAEKLGLLIPLEGVKQWVIPAKTTQLLSAIKKLIINEVAVKSGFEEWIFPRLIPEEVLAMTGWLTFHRPEIFFVNPKREIHYSKESLGIPQQRLFANASIFPSSRVSYILDTVQCVSFYYAFYNKKLLKSQLPIRIFEHQGGWTWRNEIEVDGFRKAVEFMRVELIWLGLYEDIERMRLQLLDNLTKVLSEKLGTDVLLAEGDSCFVEPSRGPYQKEDFRTLQGLSGRPSIDVVVKMSDDTYSEISSVGLHSELTKRFKISMQDADKPLWSACLGIGINRLLIYLWDKYGFDDSKWPNNIKNTVEH